MRDPGDETDYVEPTKVVLCDAVFYNCDDSTDGAPHSCDLEAGHEGDLHHCKCGCWSNC